jgi:hypothetical protein
MGTYEDTVDTLERELNTIEQTYRTLTDEDWKHDDPRLRQTG